MENAEGKRITLKRKVPNPIFQSWLEELLEEAKVKKSKLEPMLEEALASIRRYPLPLETGSQCCILKGFDKRLCTFLDKRLEVYKENQQCNECCDSHSSQSSDTMSCRSEPTNNSELPVSKPAKSNSEPINVESTSQSSNTNENNKRRNRRYKPVFKSGGYAILLGLLEHQKKNPQNLFIKKDDLISIAQKYSEESFVRPKPESFYTAWSNMKTLLNKNLVQQKRNKFMQYCLTDEGVLLAEDLLKDTKSRPTMDDIIFNGATVSTSAGPRSETNQSSTVPTKISSHPSINLSASTCSPKPDVINHPSEIVSVSPETVSSCSNSEVRSVASSQPELLELSAGAFDVILLIDKNETGGVTKKNDPTVAQFNKYPSLKHEYRNLKVGDFTWVARNKLNSSEELVLPYIVERKRMDDLGHSVKDGRFHEQKFRLRRSGIQHVFYLVENFGTNKHVGLPLQSLKQAIVNTKVHDGFKIIITDSLTETARCLAMLTKRLTVEYQDSNLIGCNQEPQSGELMTFSYFNKTSIKSKPLTVKETFIKLLLQVKGISVEKALAIVREYETPRTLFEEYFQYRDDLKRGQMLLANIKYGTTNRNLGPSISKAVYELFKS